jgi:organic radical activating enzyme
MQYPINEMFQTLQGEGYFTGVPAIYSSAGMPGRMRVV